MVSEFDFINNLRNHFNLSKIGHDCAVLPLNAEKDLVITTDLLIEDIDFRLVWADAKYIGHKALTVSLSDISAMGATPTWSMTSIGIPAKMWKTDFVDEFYKGYLKLAEKFGVELIGGDISETPDKIVIDSFVGGEVEKGKAVLRATAKPGDFIYVSGDLGGASGGLNLLEARILFNDSADSWQKELMRKQLQPSHQKGEHLVHLASSMIDISDGLSSDLGHICTSSGVGAKIFADKIPFDRNLENLQIKYSDILDLALNGGEDYELLFTVNPKNSSSKILEDFTRIGEVTEVTGKIELIRDGKSQILKPKGFSHF